MKIFIFLTGLAVFVMFHAPAQAELTLDKLHMEYNLALGDSACDELYRVPSGKNIVDLRSYPCYFRSGRYTFTLSGDAGQQVTLFGFDNYATGRGFLVIIKEDERPVWVLDISDFPQNAWSLHEATKDSGAFRAFYKPAPAFKEHLGSIRWGQWWTGETPGP